MNSETQLNLRQQLILMGVLRDLRAVMTCFVNSHNVNKTRHDSGESGTVSRPAGRVHRGRLRQCGQDGSRGQTGVRGKDGVRGKTDAHGQDERLERRSWRERQVRRVRAAREGLAPVNLWRWLGRAVTGSDRVLCHRELLRLEAAGLLKRYAGQSGRRTTHVELTANGQKIASQLLAQQDADAIDATAADETFDFEDTLLLPLDWPAVGTAVDSIAKSIEQFAGPQQGPVPSPP